MTTRAGVDVPFATAGVLISGDSMYAVGKKGQLVIPTDSVRTVWTRHFSGWRTAGLFVGLLLLIVVGGVFAQADLN